MPASPPQKEGERVELTGDNALTRVELAGTLGALHAVIGSAPHAPPEPLLAAATKLKRALPPLSQHTTSEGGEKAAAKESGDWHRYEANESLEEAAIRRKEDNNG